jgi:hypothetical protein
MWRYMRNVRPKPFSLINDNIDEGNEEEEMITKRLIWIVLIAVSLSACTTARSFFVPRKTKLGASFKSAKTNQILNPEACKNLKPVTGFDGQAAGITMKKYREDFERPAAKTVYRLSIGGIGRQ